MIRFGIRELREGVLINLIVILQTAVILVILLSIITAIRSRYTYYEPIRDYISGDGTVCYFDQARILSKEELKNSLHGNPSVYCSYKLFAENVYIDFQVYDNDLLAHYTPICKEGEWITQSDDPDTVHTVVFEKSGFHIGSTYSIKTESGEKTALVTGVMDDSTLVLYMNNAYAAQSDFRMLYADAGRFTQKIMFMSSSEADKLNMLQIASGISFIAYHDTLTEQEKADNSEVISLYGTQLRIENDTLRANSFRYIFEQLRVLSPVVISIAILLFISLVCSNAVFANRQRRTFAIFEMLGLTRSGCLRIAAWKSLLLSLISVVLVGAFLQIKPHITILEGYMIQLDYYQIIAAVTAVLLCMMISVLITAITIRSNPYTNSKNG